jgi:dihydrofolate reductase
MRKIVVTEFVSLDGVFENPGWTFPYWNDAIAQFKDDEQQSADALLLGRVTYEGFAAAWPESDDEGAPYMNNVRKYVVSTTLTNPTWNNTTVISHAVVDTIRDLKHQAGRDLLVYGSGVLVQTLMQHDLVDVYRLLVYPVVLGEGKRLFAAGSTAKLRLEETQAFASGVVGLIYTPEQ